MKTKITSFLSALDPNTFRRTVLLLTFGIFICSAQPAWSFRILFKEQLWQLHHRQLYSYPLDIAENIHWLEQALRADFANPLWALARISNPQEWEKYRHLFMMQINLTLVDLYLQWGTKYNKFEAFFFNYPWRNQNLESLEKAETLFEFALVYWEEAKRFSDLASRFRWLFLTDVQHWEDQNWRIQTGDLNYERIINRHLARLREVRATFMAMDETTF